MFVKKKISIARVFLLNMMWITFCSTFIIGYLWISDEYGHFKEDAFRIRQEYVESQKQLIRNQVEDAIQYIQNYRLMTAEIRKKTGMEPADENEIKKDILNWLVKVRFEKEGYLFGSTYKGDPLFSNGKITVNSGSIWNLTDPKGVKIIQEQRKAVENPEGGYTQYVWRKLTKSQASPKISFCRGIPEWQWIIGAGVYIDEIDAVISRKREKVEKQVKKEMYIIIGIIIALYIFIFTIARYISLKTKANFEVFSSFFSKVSESSNPFVKLEKIDLENIHFLEFSVLADAVNNMMEARIKIQKALKESEETYRNIFQNAQVGLFRTKPREGVFVECNDALAHMFGYESREECIKDYSLNHGYADPGTREKMVAIVKKYGEFKNYEAQFKKKGGGILWLRYSAKYYPEQDWIEGVGEDVTEIKKAEKEKAELQEQLNRSKKMEALGLLAGGVAHDLNNILSGIVSYPELILIDLPEDSRLRKPVQTIQEAGLRAAAVVSDLLTVARGVASPRELMNLNIIIKEYLQSPEYKELKMRHENISIITRLEDNLLNIYGSPVHLKKVVMNLVSNAFEAINQEGAVIISTLNHYVDSTSKEYNTIPQGEYTLLSISDNGPGIPQENLGRIFEPFYTKKIMGRSGTGLGLAIVWNTIQDHSGCVNVSSSESGTVFNIYLPATSRAFQNNKENFHFENYSGNGEKILVIDDEPGQREIACGILDKLKYSVHAVSSGEQAIEYLKHNTADLVLLDMIMEPGMNGRETYEHIIKIRPGQKALIISGFAETNDVKIAQKLGAGKYIKKPYPLEEIGKAVRDVLNAKSE